MITTMEISGDISDFFVFMYCSDMSLGLFIQQNAYHTALE